MVQFNLSCNRVPPPIFWHCPEVLLVRSVKTDEYFKGLLQVILTTLVKRAAREYVIIAITVYARRGYVIVNDLSFYHYPISSRLNSLTTTSRVINNKITSVRINTNTDGHRAIRVSLLIGLRTSSIWGTFVSYRKI